MWSNARSIAVVCQHPGRGIKNAWHTKHVSRLLQTELASIRFRTTNTKIFLVIWDMKKVPGGLVVHIFLWEKDMNEMEETIHAYVYIASSKYSRWNAKKFGVY